ncbi:hypothetical protein YSY43_17370 [Paenibacillus sp. YSY-4.3]
MAICIEFELVEVKGTVAQYRFGDCVKELTGLFEVDLYKLSNGETSWDTAMDKVVVLLNHGHSQAKANRAFSKIFKYYKETGEYLSMGGYYA